MDQDLRKFYRDVIYANRLDYLYSVNYKEE